MSDPQTYASVCMWPTLQCATYVCAYACDPRCNASRTPWEATATPPSLPPSPRAWTHLRRRCPRSRWVRVWYLACVCVVCGLHVISCPPPRQNPWPVALDDHMHAADPVALSDLRLACDHWPCQVCIVLWLVACCLLALCSAQHFVIGGLWSVALCGLSALCGVQFFLSVKVSVRRPDAQGTLLRWVWFINPQSASTSRAILTRH